MPSPLKTPADDAATGTPFQSFVPDDRHFRAVANCTADWESWHGPDGRLIWVNPAVERITGYTVAECLAMLDYPAPIILAEDRTEVARVLETAARRSFGSGIDFRGELKSGEVRWMSLCWQPMSEIDGRGLGFRTSIRDVTERHQMREELRLYAEHLEQLVQERTERIQQMELRQRQMEKLAALGQLAAGVAHEINNPLAGMRNAFELIRSSTPRSHEHYDLLELIDREIERISGITHQMYQLYSRVPQRPAEFALGAVVSDVVTILGSTANRREVVVQYVAPPEDPRVSLVEGEVKQILYNLIRNAIQASPTGGQVEVRIRSGYRDIAVEIVDHGAGIPPEILPRIFEPFFSTKPSDGQSGMGLGLSVSRSLIDAIGGRIDVISSPGQGSRFTAVFPKSSEHPGATNLT
jgi:two-component system sporulation sensor kinase C